MIGIDLAALAEVREALRPLPTEEGGVIVVLATAGVPPAVAMLSSGDVLVAEDRVRAALYAGASAGGRLGGAFTLLVPTGERAVRVEVGDASAREEGRLVLIEGVLAAVRPTAEPPWGIDMRFSPTAGEGVAEFLEYWQSVRRWLEGGATGAPPLS
ncbi:MAG: hypothetical protein ACRDUY_06040 [Nitriliruptorales bacterium]